MDIKNQAHRLITNTEASGKETDGSFKFTLVSHIEDQNLQARLNFMLTISAGKKIQAYARVI